MKNILLMITGSLLLAACAGTSDISASPAYRARLEKIRQDCARYYSGQDMATEGKIANCINARKAGFRL